MGFFYYDQYYFMLVIPAFLFALAMQLFVKSAYNSQSKIRNSRGITGAQAAARVLYHYGITNVRIEQVAGTMTDHFDPKTNVIRLSDGVYNSTSVAAVGIACHEAGHAAQHAENYAPIRIRNSILPVCNIGSTIGFPLAILGYFLGFEPLISVGLLLYALIAVFQLVTLPVEFNASRRALKVIEDDNMLCDDEYKGAKKVLSAAAMTYVAALAVSVANLLRFMLRFSSRRN
ncbi:MAG: zinc metallopeptidase [Clostridiales bacterium]|nr:zinc metallopeptidase [Clostridiales bacterium]